MELRGKDGREDVQLKRVRRLARMRVECIVDGVSGGLVELGGDHEMVVVV